MKSATKFPVAILLLTAPLAAYAESAPSTGLYSLVGGFAGGLLGGLLACWLCKRFGSKNDRDPRK